MTSVLVSLQITLYAIACLWFLIIACGAVLVFIDLNPRDRVPVGESLEAIYAQIDRYDALISGEVEMRHAELVSGNRGAKDDWHWHVRIYVSCSSVYLMLRIADYSQPGSWRTEEWGELSIDPVDALRTVNRALDVCAQRNLGRDLDTAVKERAKQRARALIETIREETGGESTGV